MFLYMYKYITFYTFIYLYIYQFSVLMVTDDPSIPGQICIDWPSPHYVSNSLAMATLSELQRFNDEVFRPELQAAMTRIDAALLSRVNRPSASQDCFDNGSLETDRFIAITGGAATDSFVMTTYIYIYIYI